MCSMHFGKGSEEYVDRQAFLIIWSWLERQPAIIRREELVGGDDIDVTGLDVDVVRDLLDRDGRVLLQDFRQHAFMVGLKVLHQDKCHSGGWRNGPDEAL